MSVKGFKDYIFIDINGVVQVPNTMTHEQFLDKFLEFVESLNGSFGGGTKEVDSNGNDI